MTAPLNGSCHCGAVRVAFDPGVAMTDLPLRVCQCSFCTRHGAAYTSHPEGRLHITTAPGSLRRYRFGRHTADFLICRECGCYIAAMIESDDGGALATLNVTGTHLEGFADRVGEPAVYDEEDNDARLARREARWTPTVLVEAVPNA